jgi:hypothetical protein
MSKKYSKTEEAPPLKKSIINKVEKQYGKDNPKTYATLWKIYKDKKKNEDAPSNSVGDYSRPDSSGATSGKVDMTKTKKKKKKSPWDKYSPDALGRQFRVENVEAPVAEPSITPDDTFAGVDVFKVNDNEYNNCKHGKKKYSRWDKYVDVESETGKKIYGYAKKNPNKSIIVQHDKTNHMLYLKKFEKEEE